MRRLIVLGLVRFLWDVADALQADIRLMVAIPSAGTVCLNFAASLASLVAKFAADRIATIPDKTATLQIHTVQSSNWITNREKLARMALDADFTHLMFWTTI